jgi:hypothetical protein
MSRARLALSAAALAAIGFAWIWLLQRDFFYDARAYWALDYDSLYAGSLVGRFGTYLYSPAFAQVMWPFTLLPWPLYAALWSGLNLTVLVWMARPVLAAVLLFVPFSPVTDEITTGKPAPAAGRGAGHRLPLSGHLRPAAAHQGHAGRGGGLVRRRARVEEAARRPGRDGRHQRRVVRHRRGPVAGLDRPAARQLGSGGAAGHRRHSGTAVAAHADRRGARHGRRRHGLEVDRPGGGDAGAAGYLVVGTVDPGCADPAVP